jgi:hypothetical protein
MIITRALRDPAGAAPALDRDAAALIAAAAQHRVLLLLGWMLRAAGRLSEWPEDFVRAFQQAEHAAVAVDCVRHLELVRALDRLSEAGVSVLVFKGAALAYSHYPAAHVRVRADTDLLVNASELPALEAVLMRLGYVRPTETGGDLVSYQSHYQKIDRHGVGHAFDVHWKISNLQVLADRLMWQELWQERVPLAAPGRSSFTVGRVHALLLALLHRAGHHPGSGNLLWIYDLHVLASSLSPEEMRRLQTIATARGLGHVVAEGLALARDSFGTAAAGPVVTSLRAGGPRHNAIVLDGSWTQARVLRLDLHALPTWRARGRLIREHLLPPRSYMRARYGVRSNLLLPGLYVWRALAGTPRWLRKLDS